MEIDTRFLMEVQEMLSTQISGKGTSRQPSGPQQQEFIDFQTYASLLVYLRCSTYIN